MLAIRKLARGIGNVSVEELPVPVAGPEEVVAEVDSAGICGTDLHIYLDEFETSPPVTMGHEFAGRIVEVGKNVRDWHPGDRVTAGTYFFTCGQCRYCREGRSNLCPHRRSIGSKRDGAFARYVVVPAANLYRVPDQVDLESATLTEPLACTIHGVLSVAKVQAGENVVITGPGPIGLLALQLAKAAGATVALLGTQADRARLELAGQLGADHTLEISAVTDVLKAVQDLFHAEGIDLVVECSGAGPAAETLLNLVRRGGRFCQMGLFGKPIPWNQDLVCYKELTVTGTNAHVPSAWPHALKFMAEGRVNVRRLITHRFALPAWNQALQTAQTKQGVKILLKPLGHSLTD
jgi:L-iditol 2-dehydrogenase